MNELNREDEIVGNEPSSVASLDAQLTACRRYAAERGWIVKGEYQDVLSGKRDDRPQYQQLLTDVRHPVPRCEAE